MDSVLIAGWCHSWLAFTLRADDQVIDDAADAFGLPRHHACPGAAGRRGHRTLERHDMVVGVDVDVAVLQCILVDETRAHPRGDPRVGHDLAGFADAVLGLGADDFRAFDDTVLGFRGALFDGLARALRRRGAARGQCNRRHRQYRENRDDVYGSFHDLLSCRCGWKSVLQDALIIERWTVAVRSGGAPGSRE